LFGRLCTLTVANPRGLREVLGVALGLSEYYLDQELDVLPIPSVTMMDLIADETQAAHATIVAFPQIGFSITLDEAMGLAILIQKCRARRVFEFGTHRGVSTSQLAANLPADGAVFTLDLPREDTSTRFEVNDWAEKEVANFPRKGDLIPENLRGKVTFLTQDSALFDPKPYANTMDFIFVDAAHTREYVVNDSEKAWAMLRPGGIVAWHDCRPQSPDVVKFIRACNYSPKRIIGTTLAFAVKPAS
jgi:predicted O-methyltransferase YrrM